VFPDYILHNGYHNFEHVGFDENGYWIVRDLDGELLMVSRTQVVNTNDGLPPRIYVATTDGKMYVTRDSGGSWNEIAAGALNFHDNVDMTFVVW
jgi:hypothetical protein